MTESPDKRRGVLILKVIALVRFLRRLRINIINISKVSWGVNSYVGKRADFYVPEYCVVGDNVSIGSGFTIQTNARIGNECLISSEVSFIGNDHDLGPSSRSAYYSGRLKPSCIILEGDNFIGYRTTILGDVRIGAGAVVGANSFVNRDVPPGVVVAGVPARVIKKRSEL